MISITGQWQGYYIYGPEYGEKLSGSKVSFELSLTDTLDGEFEGTCLDFDSTTGQNNLPAAVKGFIEEDFISFTKEYIWSFSIAANDEIISYSPQRKPEVCYHGYYDPITESFSGDWEFIGRESTHPEGSYLEFAAGTWEMKRI